MHTTVRFDTSHIRTPLMRGSSACVPPTFTCTAYVPGACTLTRTGMCPSRLCAHLCLACAATVSCSCAHLGVRRAIRGRCACSCPASICRGKVEAKGALAAARADGAARAKSSRGRNRNRRSCRKWPGAFLDDLGNRQQPLRRKSAASYGDEAEALVPTLPVDDDVFHGPLRPKWYS